MTWRHHVAVSAWVLLLVTLSSWTRLLCTYGLPPDCKRYATWVELMHELISGVPLGVVLGVAAGVTMPVRFGYLFGSVRRGSVFLFLLLFTIPSYGALDFLLPDLVVSEDLDPHNMPLAYKAVLGSLVGVVGLLLLWHFWYAWRQETALGFLVYVCSRLLISSIFLSYVIMGNLRVPHAEFHLHHYVIAFMVAIFAVFNHPMSMTLLGISCGVFVQGIAAYGAAEVFELNVHNKRFSYNCHNGTANTTIKTPWMTPEMAEWYVFARPYRELNVNCSMYGILNGTM